MEDHQMITEGLSPAALASLDQAYSFSADWISGHTDMARAFLESGMARSRVACELGAHAVMCPDMTGGKTDWMATDLVKALMGTIGTAMVVLSESHPATSDHDHVVTSLKIDVTDNPAEVAEQIADHYVKAVRDTVRLLAESRASNGKDDAEQFEYHMWQAIRKAVNHRTMSPQAIRADIACPHCGGYVRGHQWIGMHNCSVNHSSWDEE